MDEDISVIGESDDSSQSENEYSRNSSDKQKDMFMTSIGNHSPADFQDSQLPESPDHNDIVVISVSDSESDSELAKLKNSRKTKKKARSSKSFVSIPENAIRHEIGNGTVICGQHGINNQTASHIKQSVRKPPKRKLTHSHSLDKDWKQTKLDAYKTDSSRLSLDAQLPVITKDPKKGATIKNKHNAKDVISTQKQSYGKNRVSKKRATSPNTIKLFSSSAESAEEAIEEIDSRSDSDVSLSEYEDNLQKKSILIAKNKMKANKHNSQNCLNLNTTPSSPKVSIKKISPNIILHKLKSKEISSLVGKALSERQTSSQNSQDRKRFSRLSLCKNKNVTKDNSFQSSSEEDLTQKLNLDSWDDNHIRPRSQSPNIFSGSDTEIQALDKDATIIYMNKSIDKDATLPYRGKTIDKDATLPYRGKTIDKDATLPYKGTTIDKDATLPYMDTTVEDSEGSLTQSPSLSPVHVLTFSESDSYTDDNVPLQISINNKTKYCEIKQLLCDSKLEKVQKLLSHDSNNKLGQEKGQPHCDFKNRLGKAVKQFSCDLEGMSRKEKESITISLPDTDDESTQEPDYSLFFQSNPSDGTSSFHSLVPRKESPKLSSDDSLPDCDFLTQPSPATDHSKHKPDHENKQNIKASKNKSDSLVENCYSVSTSKNLSKVSVLKHIIEKTSTNIESKKDVFTSVKVVNAKRNKDTKMQIENETFRSTGVNAPSSSSNKEKGSSMHFQETDDEMTNTNDPSPIFRRSKPINLQESLPWPQTPSLPVLKKTIVANSYYSPSSNIFEKMAASSQNLLKESQIEDDNVVDDEEMIQIPILNLKTSDSNLHLDEPNRVTEKDPNIDDHLQKNCENSQGVGAVSAVCNDIQKTVVDINKEDDTYILKNSSGVPETEIPTLMKEIKKEAIDDEIAKQKDAAFSDLPIALNEIKQEIDEDVIVKYTQDDDDDVIDVFDSDDEEALFAMSQVQVSFKAEPLSDGEDDAEDDLSAMGELYLKKLNEDNIEPRTKVPKLANENFTSRAAEPVTEDVDFFHNYYMKDGHDNPHETITATQRVARPSTPVDSQLLDSDCDDAFLSHIAKIGCNLGKENENSCQTLNETSNQKQVVASTVVCNDDADKAKDVDFFKLFDSDSDDSYNERTLLDERETSTEVLNISSDKEINNLDSFQCYNQSTIVVDESDDYEEFQTGAFSVTDHARNLVAQQQTPTKKSDSSTTLHLDKIKEKDSSSKRHSTFETGSDEELFNLMSEAGGIQSPGKIISYSPKLKSKISDKLVPDNELPSKSVSDEMTQDEDIDKDSSRDEVSMDESDTELYMAATQQVPEDNFDYDFGTQAVDTSDKSMVSTKKFYSHDNVLKGGPKKLVEIEPRRQESSKEIRDKFKKSMEVVKKKTSEQKHLHSNSSSKISNSSKKSSEWKASSSATNSISTSSKSSGKGSLSKNLTKSNWMNSIKRKFSPQKKPAKKQRRKTKDDDSFSFTQKIGMARKQMKHRNNMPDAPKIPSAQYTKCHYKEAVTADTCSDVELPNMSQIIEKQLPIMTCDVNEMKRNREKQRRKEVDKTKRSVPSAPTGSSKDNSKVNTPSSSNSSEGKSTFVKPKSKSSSSRSSSDKGRHSRSSSSSKSGYKDHSTKKSPCIDEVNEHRKLSSKVREERTILSSGQGDSGASKKSAPATKGISVIDTVEKGGNKHMLLDDLINNLGPIDKPAHLPFQSKPKTKPKNACSNFRPNAGDHANDSKKERYFSVKPSSSDKSHVGRAIVDENVIRKPNDALKNFKHPGISTSSSKVTSDRQSTNILLNQSRASIGRLTTNNQPNQPSVNNMSIQLSTNNVSDQPSISNRAMVNRKDPRVARRDPRILSSSDISNPTSNLMLKPTTAVNLGTNRENTSDNVNKLFSNEDYFKLILNWNPVWLNEQDKITNSKNVEMPPLLGKNNPTFPLLESYSNVEEYQKILLNLMVLETWEMVFRDWKEKHAKKRNMIFNVGLQRIFVDKESPLFTTLTWQNILPEGVHRSGKFPREGDLVRIDLWGAIYDKSRTKEEQKPKWFPQMGYVEHVKITQNQPLGELCAKAKSLQEDPLCEGERVTSITVVTKLKNRTFLPIGNRLMKLEVLSCLVTNMRQISALAYLSRSCLCKELIKPGNERVFVHPIVSSKDLMSEFDASQAEAIKTICLAMQQPDIVPKVCILQGPPGTGKSHTIVGLINSIIKGSGIKVCICLATPSNAAADELMRRLKKDKLNKRQNGTNTIKFVRIGNVDNMHADIKEYCWDVLFENNKAKELREKQRRNIPDSVKQELKRLEEKIHHLKQMQKGHDTLKVKKCQIDLNKLIQQQRNLEKQSLDSINIHERLTQHEEYNLKKGILLNADVICGTLSSFGNPRILNLLKYDAKSQRKPFNCLIIDEASQAAEIDCLIPLQYGMSKIILVGDPEQLPATVLSKKAGEMNFGQSLLERLYNYFQHNNPKAIIMLKTQYRMDKNIFSFPNRLVYNGQLHTHPSVDQVCNKFPLKPYLVFDMKCGKEMVEGSAICNMVEAQCTVELCVLLSSEIQPNCIGVICPYQSQKALVLEGLRIKKLYKVEVNTVDGFQGREKSVIILTCVRAQSLTGGIGFLADRRRMNVALTRAKNALYILGHVTSLQKNDVWKLLIEDAVKRDVVKPVTYQDQFTQVAKCCFK